MGTGLITKTYSGQFKSPQMADLLSIKLLAKKQDDLNSCIQLRILKLNLPRKSLVFFMILKINPSQLVFKQNWNKDDVPKNFH